MQAILRLLLTALPFILMVGCKETPPARTPPAAESSRSATDSKGQEVVAGDTAVLVWDDEAEEGLVADSPEADEELSSLSEKLEEDRMSDADVRRFRQLQDTGKLFTVKRGTKLEIQGIRDIKLFVKITSGENAGRSGWVVSSDVEKQ